MFAWVVANGYPDKKKGEALASGEEEGKRRALEGLLLQCQCQNEGHCYRHTPRRRHIRLPRPEFGNVASHHRRTLGRCMSMFLV